MIIIELRKKIIIVKEIQLKVFLRVKSTYLKKNCTWNYALALQSRGTVSPSKVVKTSITFLLLGRRSVRARLKAARSLGIDFPKKLKTNYYIVKAKNESFPLNFSM